MTYRNDPRWITLKYDALPSRLNTGGDGIPKGTRVFYYPLTSRMLTGEEAEQAARDFEASRFDEDMCR